MHLVAITRIKNEADIIEPFVRHTCRHFDEIIIQDHDSTDETLSIVNALRDEGLRIHIKGTTSRNTQGFDMTAMMQDAFGRGAQWVMPLDADEFVETPGGTTLRDMLKLRDNEPLNVFWNNFAACSGARIEFHNPVVAMRSRNTRQSQFAKVCVPRSFGMDVRTKIYEGSHFLTRRGKFLPAHDVLDVVLCHYPIRSIEQFAYKVAIGTFRYIANPSEDEHSWGWHYEKAFKYLIDGNIEGLKNVMQETALSYSEESPRQPRVIDSPLRYLGGDLSHQPRIMTDGDVLRGVLAYTKGIALDLHKAKKKSSIFRKLFNNRRG